MGGGISGASQGIPEFIDFKTFSQLNKQQRQPYSSEAFFKFVDYQDKITKARFEQVIMTKDCYLSYEWGIDARGRSIPARVKKLTELLSSKGLLVYSEDGSFKNHHITNSNGLGGPEPSSPSRTIALLPSVEDVPITNNYNIMDKTERIRENYHYVQCFCMLLTDRYLQKLIAKPSTTSSMNFMTETNISQKHPKLTTSSKVKTMNPTPSSPSTPSTTNLVSVSIPTKNQIQLEIEELYAYHVQTNAIRGRNEFIRCCIPIYLDNYDELQEQIKGKYLPYLPSYLQEVLVSKPGILLDEFELDGGQQITKLIQYLSKVIIPVKQGGGLFFQSHVPRSHANTMKKEIDSIPRMNGLEVPYQGKSENDINLSEETLLRYQQTHFQFLLQYFTTPGGGGGEKQQVTANTMPSIPLRTLQLYAKVFARQGFESPLRLIPYLLPHAVNSNSNGRKTINELDSDHYLLQLGIAKEHIPIIHKAILSQIHPFLPQNITPTSTALVPIKQGSVEEERNQSHSNTSTSGSKRSHTKKGHHKHPHSLLPAVQSKPVEAKEWIWLSEKEIEGSKNVEEAVLMRYEDMLGYHIRSMLQYDGQYKAKKQRKEKKKEKKVKESVQHVEETPLSSSTSSSVRDYYDYFQYQQEYDQIVKMLSMHTLPSISTNSSSSSSSSSNAKKEQIQWCCKILRQQIVILEEIMTTHHTTNTTANSQKELSNRLVLHESTAEEGSSQGYAITSLLPGNLAMIPGNLHGPVLDIHPNHDHNPNKQDAISLTNRFSFHIQMVYTCLLKCNEFLTTSPAVTSGNIGKESEEYSMLMVEEGMITLIMYLVEVFTTISNSTSSSSGVEGYNTHGVRLTSCLFSPFLSPPPTTTIPPPVQPCNLPTPQSSFCQEEEEEEEEESVIRSLTRTPIIRSSRSTIRHTRTTTNTNSNSPSRPRHHSSSPPQVSHNTNNNKKKQKNVSAIPTSTTNSTTNSNTTVIPRYARYLAQDQHHLYHHKTLLEAILLLMNHLIQPSIRHTITNNTSNSTNSSSSSEQIVYLFHRQQILLYLQSLVIYYLTTTNEDDDDGLSCEYIPASTVLSDCNTSHTGNVAILATLLETIYTLLPSHTTSSTILDAFLFPVPLCTGSSSGIEGNPILSSELPYTHTSQNTPFHPPSNPLTTTSTSLSSSLIELIMIILEKYTAMYVNSPFSLHNTPSFAISPLNITSNTKDNGVYRYTSQGITHQSEDKGIQSSERYYEMSVLVYTTALMIQLMSLSFTIHSTNPLKKRNYDLIFQKYRPFSVMATVNTLLHTFLDVQPVSPVRHSASPAVSASCKLLYFTQYPRLWYLFTHALENLTYHHQKIVFMTTECIDLFGFVPKQHSAKTAAKTTAKTTAITGEEKKSEKHHKHHKPHHQEQVQQRKRTVREQLAVHLQESDYIQYILQSLSLLSSPLLESTANTHSNDEEEHTVNRYGNKSTYPEYILILVLQFMRNVGNIISQRPDLKAIVLSNDNINIASYCVHWIDYSIKVLREQPYYKGIYFELITESLLTLSNLFTVSIHTPHSSSSTPSSTHQTKVHDYERWNSKLYSVILTSGLSEMLMILCYEYASMVLDIRLFVSCLLCINKLLLAPSLSFPSTNATQYTYNIPCSTTKNSPIRKLPRTSPSKQSTPGYGGYGSGIGMGYCSQGTGNNLLGQYQNTGAFVFCHRMVTLGFIEKLGTLLQLQHQLLSPSPSTSSNPDPNDPLRSFQPYSNNTNTNTNANTSSLFLYEQICNLLIAFASSDSHVINAITRLINKTQCEAYITSQMKACCLLHCDNSHHWAHFYSHGILLAQSQEQKQRQMIEYQYEIYWKAQMNDWIPKRMDAMTGEMINEEEETLLAAPEELLDEKSKKQKALLLLDKNSFKFLPRSNTASSSTRPLSAFVELSSASSRSSTVPPTPMHGTPSFGRKSLASMRIQSFSNSFNFNKSFSSSHAKLFRKNSALSIDSNNNDNDDDEASSSPFFLSRTMSGIILPSPSQRIPTILPPTTNTNQQHSLLASLSAQQSQSWISTNTMNHRSRPASTAFGQTITTMEELLAQPIETPSSSLVSINENNVNNVANNSCSASAEKQQQPQQQLIVQQEMPSDYPYTCLTSQSLVCTSCIYSCRVIYALCKHSKSLTSSFALSSSSSSSSPSLFETIRTRIEKVGFTKLLARSPAIHIDRSNYDDLFTELYQSSVLPFSTTSATVIAVPKRVLRSPIDKRVLQLKDVEEEPIQEIEDIKNHHADAKTLLLDNKPSHKEEKGQNEKEDEEKREHATDPQSLITTRYLSAEEANLIGHRNIEFVGNISNVEFDEQMNELFSIFLHDYGKFASAK